MSAPTLVGILIFAIWFSNSIKILPGIRARVSSSDWGRCCPAPKVRD